MKKIMIWMTSMHLGGVERALIGLLHSLDYNRVSVDLFLNRHEGELMNDIPQEVNLLPEHPRYASLAEPYIQTLKRGQILPAIGRLYAKIVEKVKFGGTHNNGGVSVEYSQKYTKAFLPKVAADIEYDLAISFVTPHYFVAEKVRSKTKIAWIHTDYTNITLDIPSQRKMWRSFDYIVSISEDVSKCFTKIFPEFTDRVIKIENILPEKLVRKQAKEHTICFEKPGVHLLSIGRYSYPKNFDSIPEICAYIVAQGIDVNWHIIGYGDGEQIIRKKISEYHMESRIKLLGKKDNPYPYIAACDVYVQPSRFEGKCVSVREAQMLGKPVIITDYPTAHSQLEDGVDGVIIPLETKACAEAIAEILKEGKTLERISQICRKRDYSNAQEVEKIYKLL